MLKHKPREQGISLAGIHHGTATVLGAFADGMFDAVLMLGPLYHLCQDAERQQAVREAKRVLRPGGILFAAFLNRYELFRYAAQHDPELLVREPDVFEALLTTGIAKFRMYPEAFSSFSYWSDPLAIEPFMTQLGLETVAMLNCEGIVSDIEQAVNELQGAAWQTWVDWNYRLAKQPELLASAIHILYVGKKP